MNEVQLNDLRGIIMALFLFLGVFLTVSSASINTARRILRIYRWTDVRYKQLLMLSGCIFFCTLAISSFDAAQRIATVGTGFSNWFATGTLPAAVYHYAVLSTAGAMLPFDFALFLYKAYHTEKGDPDAGIAAEMMLLTALPVMMVLAHYAAGAVVFLLDKYMADGSYGISASVKAGLFLLSVIYLAYDTYSIKKCFDYTKLDVLKKGSNAKPIWEEKNGMHRGNRAAIGLPDWIRCRAEMLYWRLKDRK